MPKNKRIENLKENRKFLRQCICCRMYKNKTELIRITREFKSGEIKINNNSALFGRSVYICKNINCIENTIKKRKIEHLLKTNLPEEVKEFLCSKAIETDK